MKILIIFIGLAMVISACGGIKPSEGDIQTAIAHTQAAQATVQLPSSGFIKTIEEFENSPFCKTYHCKPYKALAISKGTNHPYMIDNYPKYNEFYIEVITRDSQIIDYGITLDPKRITRDELQLIEIFLSSYSSNAVTPQVMEFVSQNLDNKVNQICKSNSIEFNTMRLWVGSVGLAPTVMVADKCEYMDTEASIPTNTPVSTVIPSTTDQTVDIDVYLEKLSEILINCQIAILDYGSVADEVTSNPSIVIQESWQKDMESTSLTVHKCAYEIEGIESVPSVFDEAHTIILAFASELHLGADNMLDAVGLVRDGELESYISKVYSSVAHMNNANDYLTQFTDTLDSME